MDCDEFLDLVSIDDEVIGREKRSVIYSQGLSNFRGVFGFICNSEKKLWIPRRHPNKREYPLHLDASVGGHVASGESYDEAFVRETKEELNIALKPGEYSPLVRLTPHEHAVTAFSQIYIIKSDKVPQYNADDFVEYFWLSPDEFFAKIIQGDRARGNLSLMVRGIGDSYL
jgi:isopentenyldiphosphate isomerase